MRSLQKASTFGSVQSLVSISRLRTMLLDCCRLDYHIHCKRQSQQPHFSYRLSAKKFIDQKGKRITGE